MTDRVLVSDSDPQVLNLAMGTLRENGYSVIIECSPREALRLARKWLPNLIIAPASCLEIWASTQSEGLKGLLPKSAFLITAHDHDDLEPWLRWIDDRSEVLMKPVVHSVQLLIAAEAALDRINIKHGSESG